MSYEVEPIVINTDGLNPPGPANTLWENRASVYQMNDAPGVLKCSILIIGYNRLQKTRTCVECILKYSNDVDYELILVDNGSDDDTYAYYQSVPYEKKIIVRVTKNLGSGYPLKYVLRIYSGKYLVVVSNDVYVTKNWLSNLLTCYESDHRIGFVAPVSSNISNLQQVDLNFKDFNDMQKKAAEFNQSNPTKWEERMRLINIISILSRHVIDTVGIFDPAFVHDFSEDDYCARLRRSGYKLILCGDTWICHDHDFRNMEDKDPVKFQQSIDNGRASYREKFFDIDAWDDINNFEATMFSVLETTPIPFKMPRSLVVDGRCGTPILEIRNRLRRRGITNCESYAFTTKAKYYLDLHTVAGDVQCDRIDFIQSCYADNMFDIAVLCESVNTYTAPITLLQRLYNLLKPNGVLLFKLRNTDDFNAFLRSTGLGGKSDADLPTVLPLGDVSACLKHYGGRDITVTAECENLSDNDRNMLMKLLRAVNPMADNTDLMKLIAKYYIFRAIKG